MNIIKQIIIYGLLLSIPNVYALESDSTKPIDIESTSQDFDMLKNTITFDGNVIITQGSIKINADKVVVLRQERKKEIINAYGHPMKFRQVLEGGNPIEGQANKANYNLDSEFLTLTGNAKLKQLDSYVEANKITYDVKKQQLKATKQGKNSRVKTILIPTQLQN